MQRPAFVYLDRRHLIGLKHGALFQILGNRRSAGLPQDDSANTCSGNAMHHLGADAADAKTPQTEIPVSTTSNKPKTTYNNSGFGPSRVEPTLGQLRN